MAVAGVAGQRRARAVVSPVMAMRLAALVGLLAVWEAVSASGLLYRGVIPSIGAILRALAAMLVTAELWQNFAVSAWEVLGALAIGGSVGLAVGLGLGASRFAGRAYEPFVHYVAPTPKIIFLPVLLVAFGVGPGSKLALGAISAFFPMVLSVAAGVRGVDPVLLRVGASFRLTRWQVVRMIYLPALVAPVSVGLRLAWGLAIIGSLLAEIALSNAGLGYLAGQFYAHFQIPEMYAVLVIVFVMAALGNAVILRVVRPRGAAAR